MSARLFWGNADIGIWTHPFLALAGWHVRLALTSIRLVPAPVNPNPDFRQVGANEHQAF